MKVHEVESGRGTAFTVMPAQRGVKFAGIFAPGAEVALRPDGNAAVLSHGAELVPVVGASKADERALEDLLGKNLPRVASVGARRPRQGPAETLTVSVRSFGVPPTFPEELAIGVEERGFDDLRRLSGRVLSDGEALDWLKERLVLEPEPGRDGARLVVGIGAGEERTFLILGKGLRAHVRRRDDDRLFVERLTRPGRNTAGAIPMLVAGRFDLVDATAAAAMRGSARTLLSALVERGESFLSIWREYHRLETARVMARLREYPQVPYSSRRSTGMGGWRFETGAADAFAELEDDLVIEAAEDVPAQLSEDATEVSGETAKRKIGYLGRIRRTNGRVVELSPNDEDRPGTPPPEKGFLFVSPVGDEKRLARRERARALIASGDCHLPQLSFILEGQLVPVGNRRQYVEGDVRPLVSGMFGSEGPTPRQMQAILVALNTSDMALVQGPPGTGKTQTIRAIERCLAELKKRDGARITASSLLSSAQHDAVENAMGKLTVFGLPAVKVGRRRTDEGEREREVEDWCRKRIDDLRAKLSTLPKGPAAPLLEKVKAHALSYALSPLAPVETARLLEEVLGLVRAVVPDALVKRLFEEIRRRRAPSAAAGDDARELARRAVRGLRVDSVAFSDDGPVKAAAALRRLEAVGVGTPADRDLLERAAGWREPSAAELQSVGALRDRLLDELAPIPVTMGPLADPAVSSLLADCIDAVHAALARGEGGVAAALEGYLDALENDPVLVRKTLSDYTAVLAATLQQADSFAMLAHTEHRRRFESVVVDEAARANPLDLMIPLAMAGERVILVGDHRQLPQLLEPDVERTLEAAGDATALATVRESLFERLYAQFRAEQEAGGPRRVVTLDVQYRMHPVLGEYVSSTYYPPTEQFKWGRPASDFVHGLPGYGDACAAWIDVPIDKGEETRGRSKSRPAEARVIARQLHELMVSDAGQSLSFGAMSFYSAQVEELRRALVREGVLVDDGERKDLSTEARVRGTMAGGAQRLLVGTVDAFQGREFDVVFLSMTRSNELATQGPDDERGLRAKFGHLLLENRLCVGTSRQQRLLVVVGDGAMLTAPGAAERVKGLVEFRRLCRENAHGLVR